MSLKLTGSGAGEMSRAIAASKVVGQNEMTTVGVNQSVKVGGGTQTVNVGGAQAVTVCRWGRDRGFREGAHGGD